MLDLNDQLTNYWAQLDEAYPEITVEELDRGEAPVTVTRTPGLRRRPVLVALAAAAVLLVVLAAVVLLDPFGVDDSPFIEDPTTTTVPASATTEAAPTTSTAEAATTTTASAPLLPVITWELIEDEALDPSGSVLISDVIAAGPGLIAVGDIWSDEDEMATGVIWYSTDGRTWTRVPHEDQVFNNTTIRAIAEGGPGLVAVGNAWNEEFPDSDNSAAVWVSEDGMSWSRVPHNEEVFGGPALQEMFDVTAGGPGLVAVGWDNPLDVWDASAAVWTSVDGLAWERIPHVESIFGGTQMQVMWGVTTDGSQLVAVGHDGLWSGSGGANQPAAVWTSQDGLTWARVRNQMELTTGQDSVFGGDWAIMEDVIAGGPGFVAVGRMGLCRDDCDETGGVWTSVDGTTWHRSQVEKAFGIPYSYMFGVTEIGSGALIGVGHGLDPFTGGGPAVVWASVDGGQNWIRQPHSGTQFGRVSGGPVNMTAVTEFGSQLVAVGEWESDAAVWIGTIED